MFSNSNVFQNYFIILLLNCFKICFPVISISRWYLIRVTRLCQLKNVKDRFYVNIRITKIA